MEQNARNILNLTHMHACVPAQELSLKMNEGHMTDLEVLVYLKYKEFQDKYFQPAVGAIFRKNGRPLRSP